MDAEPPGECFWIQNDRRGRISVFVPEVPSQPLQLVVMTVLRLAKKPRLNWRGKRKLCVFRTELARPSGSVHGQNTVVPITDTGLECLLGAVIGRGRKLEACGAERRITGVREHDDVPAVESMPLPVVDTVNQKRMDGSQLRVLNSYNDGHRRQWCAARVPAFGETVSLLDASIDCANPIGAAATQHESTVSVGGSSSSHGPFSRRFARHVGIVAATRRACPYSLGRGRGALSATQAPLH